jgi:hypothetical protein
MALASEQKIGVNANFDRTTIDTIKDASGNPLKSAVFVWQYKIQDESLATFGTTVTCAFLVNVNGTPVGDGYIGLGAGSIAITSAGVMWVKTGAAGTDTWVNQAA